MTERLTGAAGRLGYPVALKAWGPALVHKSDVGGVELDLGSDEDLRAAAEGIRSRLGEHGALDRLKGFLVQEMGRGTHEAIVGMSSDPVFGPLLMFGLGGKYVEVFRDVAFRVIPLTDVDADEMIRSIRGHALLEGVRGEEAVDVAALKDILLRVSRMVTDLELIDELDLNPILLSGRAEDIRIADLRLRVRSVPLADE